jgi:hypothetical protein
VVQVHLGPCVFDGALRSETDVVNDGAVAQLGERQLCKLDVVGSIPISSTFWNIGSETFFEKFIRRVEIQFCNESPQSLERRLWALGSAVKSGGLDLALEFQRATYGWA